jgi:hypothetical protein
MRRTTTTSKLQSQNRDTSKNGMRAPISLSPEKQQALSRARASIAKIEQLVPQERERRSQKREQSLLSAYNTLSKQSSPLGIGIRPFYGYEPEMILKIATQFKQQIEQRYPI